LLRRTVGDPPGGEQSGGEGEGAARDHGSAETQRHPSCAGRFAATLQFGAGVHLLTGAAAGLGPEKAHWLTRPDAWEGFGYRADDLPQVTERDRERLGRADELTREIAHWPAPGLLPFAAPASGW
jgi:hypothetical protein